MLLLPLLLLPFLTNGEPIWSRGIGRRTRATTQYHTQDPTSGAYQYGYSGPHHSKSESSLNGVTRGGYSYIDANGLMQTVSYTADAENGFRVQASNLPGRNTLSSQDTGGDVTLGKRRHLEQLRRVDSWQPPQLQRQYQIERTRPRSPFLLTAEEARSIPAPRPSNAVIIETNSDGDDEDETDEIEDESGLRPPRRFGSSYVLAPSPATASIIAVPLPLIHSSMRHTQDSLGQYEYSYTGDTSAKTESRSLDGTTRGAYSYIDANGILQQVHYIADRDGFRVLATNLPEA